MDSNHSLSTLPPNANLDTPNVLRQLIKSHRYLAELKGTAKTIPNEYILISTLSLQEAKDSSEIENIVTTHDEMYRENIDIDSHNPDTKEVINYSQSLKYGFEIVKHEKLLLNRHILEIQKILEKNDAGFRKQFGTVLMDGLGKVVYTPPQNPGTVIELMGNLEKYINDDDFSDLDPLIKMAVIHYQFESIHPFYDGNGRTGRIINILYLVLKGLLDYPILYLSRFIIQNKNEYYRVLQNVRKLNDWESLILYFLRGVEQTSKDTIKLILSIKNVMQDYKNRLRIELPKIYSQELLNILFSNPYTKIDFIQKTLGISYLTARKYLELLSDKKYLTKIHLGKSNYYINKPLLDIFVK